jgi:hypothetical protein
MEVNAGFAQAGLQFGKEKDAGTVSIGRVGRSSAKGMSVSMGRKMHLHASEALCRRGPRFEMEFFRRCMRFLRRRAAPDQHVGAQIGAVRPNHRTSLHPDFSKPLRFAPNPFEDRSSQFRACSQSCRNSSRWSAAHSSTKASTRRGSSLDRSPAFRFQSVLQTLHSGVEMRWIVIVGIHSNNNSKKSAQFWHGTGV